MTSNKSKLTKTIHILILSSIFVWIVSQYAQALVLSSPTEDKDAESVKSLKHELAVKDAQLKVRTIQQVLTSANMQVENARTQFSTALEELKKELGCKADQVILADTLTCQDTPKPVKEIKENAPVDKAAPHTESRSPQTKP